MYYCSFIIAEVNDEFSFIFHQPTNKLQSLNFKGFLAKKGECSAYIFPFYLETTISTQSIRTYLSLTGIDNTIINVTTTLRSLGPRNVIN